MVRSLARRFCFSCWGHGVTTEWNIYTKTSFKRRKSRSARQHFETELKPFSFTTKFWFLRRCQYSSTCRSRGQAIGMRRSFHGKRTPFWLSLRLRCAGRSSHLKGVVAFIKPKNSVPKFLPPWFAGLSLFFFFSLLFGHPESSKLNSTPKVLYTRVRIFRLQNVFCYSRPQTSLAFSSFILCRLTSKHQDTEMSWQAQIDRGPQCWRELQMHIPKTCWPLLVTNWVE